MALFPAVLIGGPPNSGKSVLATSLTHALRQREVEHYVLRACPDGEGDWTQQADQALVRTILIPRAWTSAFVDHVCRDLQRRHLPLLVDMGGRPQPWQEGILDHCTHAILLTPDEDSRGQWGERLRRHGVSLLADLHSALEGPGSVDAGGPVLRGTLVGLRRGVLASGPAFEALVNRLEKLFFFSPPALRQAHLQSAPAEIVVELDRLKRALGIGGDPLAWDPASLPQIVDYMPAGVPLALYGRGPNWLYAALALLARPAEFYQFDVRLGWVTPARVALGPSMSGRRVQVCTEVGERHTFLEFSLPGAFIDYLDAQDLCVPDVPVDQGVVLSGKLPHWLLTGIALAYHQAPWLAVYQPQEGGAIVVHACPERRKGACPEQREGACPEWSEGACPEWSEGSGISLGCVLPIERANPAGSQ